MLSQLIPVAPEEHRRRFSQQFFVRRGDTNADIPFQEDCIHVSTAYCQHCEKEARILEVPERRRPWYRCCGRAA